MARHNTLPLKIVLLTLIFVFVVATGVATWLVHQVTQPQTRKYIITPDKFTKLSVRGVKVTNETWTNPDGTKAQGWLLRGAKGAPAVVMLHGYGADRSWLLNLGVKLNEATNFTVLWPDLRGHGERRGDGTTSFGMQEVEDMGAAVTFLKGLKVDEKTNLISSDVGLYGVELGAYVSMLWAQKHPEVRALALDSVPSAGADTIHTAVSSYSGFDNAATRFFVPLGTWLYYTGNYRSESTCDVAQKISTMPILLLSGANSGTFRASTDRLANCFPNRENLEVKNDLAHAAFVTESATGEQGEAYDRIVINFFDRTLRGGAPADPKQPKLLTSATQ